MHSAAVPSTSAAASTSAFPSTTITTTPSRHHSNNHHHHHHHHHDEQRSSVLRQHSDEERSINKNGSHLANGSRPASKARRTSSGGSRIPTEDVGNQYRDNQAGGSSASDSGSDWRHGPKSHSSTAASSIPLHPSTSTSASVLADGSVENENRNKEEMPDREASTSSSYFNKAAVMSSSSNTDEETRRNSNVASSAESLDLAQYPPQDLLRLLAALLAQIAAANDQLRPQGGTAPSSTASSEVREKGKESGSAKRSNNVSASSSGGSITSLQDGKHDPAKEGQSGVGTSSPGISQRPTTAALSALQAPSSTLCFHARNVPSISIESYLLRILKYCPATNEVFLSLLIYFDRMSKMGTSATPSASKSASTTSTLDLPETTDELVSSVAQQAKAQEQNGSDQAIHAGMKGFAIDSYNVHRLVIAGVTVASKFFSDVFYTNSRYAKVSSLFNHVFLVRKAD